jgi:hypothetical protein
LVIIFIFTGVYLKYASVSQAAKVFDSNFLLLICRLGRAPWQTRMVSGWRGYVLALKKRGAFRDVFASKD